MKNCKIDVNLSERNRARLETKTYESAYTDVPNRALPEALKAEMGVIYEALTGDALPEDSIRSRFVPIRWHIQTTLQPNSVQH